MRYHRRFPLRARLALWAQSQAAVPHRCLAAPLPRCERAGARGQQGRGKKGGVLLKFRPTQHFPLLVRFVSSISLEFFFSFLFMSSFEGVALDTVALVINTQRQKQSTSDYSNACVCVGIPE